MPRNTAEDLRNHLFETIEMLKENEIEVPVAKQISIAAKEIINIAKVEIDAYKTAYKCGSVESKESGISAFLSESPRQISE